MRGRPGSVRSLEEFGRVRLSASFFMRDFLHSEIADRLHDLHLVFLRRSRVVVKAA